MKIFFRYKTQHNNNKTSTHEYTQMMQPAGAHFFMTCLSEDGCDVKLCQPERIYTTSYGDQANKNRTCLSAKHIKPYQTVYFSPINNDTSKWIMTDPYVECQSDHLPHFEPASKDTVFIQGGCVTGLFGEIDGPNHRPNAMQAICVQGKCNWLEN